MSQPINNWQINGNFPVSVGGTGTTAKYFPAPSGLINTTGTAPSATNAAGQLAVPGGNRLNAQQFVIRASGNYEVGPGGACPAVTIDVVANTGTIAAPVYTVLMTSGAITAQNLLSTFYDWYFEADVQGSTGSGTLQGRYSAVVDTTVVKNNVALQNTLTGLNFGPALGNNPPNALGTDPVFGLLCRVTFSVSEPGNAANMYEFALY